ncbi:MAG: hypothetical protein FJZ56_02135 [Chlamydiae bacterium]|nr:hypothetical protein [Chlamydiota bacterium]
MIPKMRKFLFTGAEGEMGQFFAKAQEIGEIEFASLTSKKPMVTPESIKEIVESLKILRKQPVIHDQEVLSPYDAKTKVKDILFHVKEIESFQEQARILKVEIARIHPLGQFSLEDIQKLRKDSGKFVQFFVARRARIQDKDLPDSLVHINFEFDQDYFLYVGPKPYSDPLFTEIVITKSLEDLEIELKKVEERIAQFVKELQLLAVYQNSIKEALSYELNKHHLHEAENLADFHLEGYLFFVEAWVPENKMASLVKLTSDLAVFSEEVAIDEKDVVPTFMENSGFAAVGEDLVNIYDTPSINDKDPSGWVFWAFAFFFSIIVADAGYGFLYLLLSLWLWKKFPKWTGFKRRFQKLLTVLASFCIVWGVLIGSYFSVQIAPDSPVNRASVLYYLAAKKVEVHVERQDETYQEWLRLYPDIKAVSEPVEILKKGVEVKDSKVKYELLGTLYDGILLEIALIVGIVHMALSMLRNLRRSVSGLGWVLFLIGGYLYFPYMLSAETLVQYLGIMSSEAAKVLGTQLLSVGIGFAIIAALIQEKWAGAGEILKAIQVFADALSYLRLYALGMASMIMAVTFNELGEMVGLTFGIFIIILGHLVNITIGMMGGVIHGLRLNFLEWYHYSFEGGGKPFNPLKIIKLGD